MPFPDCIPKFGEYICAGDNLPGWQGVKKNSHEECATSCYLEQDCAGWTFNSQSKGCWLKTTTECTVSFSSGSKSLKFFIIGLKRTSVDYWKKLSPQTR